MAVSTSSYFSNAIVGTPGQGADVDLYQSSTLPKYQVGFGFTRGDGNVYHYGHFGALTNRGQVVSKLASETNQTKIENVGALVANLTKQGGEIMNPNAIGSRYMQLVITATANQFAGGYLTVTTGNGAGFTYRIKGNDATSAQVTGNTFLNLYDPVQVAIDSNSDIIIAGSPYADLFPATTVTITAATVAGVACTNNSAGSYGFICTGGIIGALQDANTGTYGRNVYLSSTTVGAVQCMTATISVASYALYPQIGYIVEAGSSADYSLIMLNLN